jgi:hypothetical protein
LAEYNLVSVIRNNSKFVIYGDICTSFRTCNNKVLVFMGFLRKRGDSESKKEKRK